MFVTGATGVVTIAGFIAQRRWILPSVIISASVSGLWTTRVAEEPAGRVMYDANDLRDYSYRPADAVEATFSSILLVLIGRVGNQQSAVRFDASDVEVSILYSPLVSETFSCLPGGPSSLDAPPY